TGHGRAPSDAGVCAGTEGQPGAAPPGGHPAWPWGTRLRGGGPSRGGPQTARLVAAGGAGRGRGGSLTGSSGKTHRSPSSPEGGRSDGTQSKEHSDRSADPRRGGGRSGPAGDPVRVGDARP